jgi:hypothetical protein
MARIRTIKPDIADDEKLGRCSVGARLLFVYCITIADDAGRFRGTERYLRARLFPHDGEELTAARVGEWLGELTAAGLVRTYEVEGETFAELRGWGRHQRVDNARHLLIPPPPWAPSVNGSHTDSDIFGNPRNPSEQFGGIPLDREQEGNRNRTPEGEQDRSVRARRRVPANGHGARPSGAPDLFPPDELARLWNDWPEAKRGDVAEVERWWRKAVKAADVETVVASATAWLRYWSDEVTPDRYVTRLDRWLRNGNWKTPPPEGDGDEARLARKRRVIEDFINEGNEGNEP